VEGVFHGFINAIYSFLFMILSWFKDVFDMCYIMVRKLVGIDTYYYNGVEVGNGTSAGTVTGDIIEILIRSEITRNLFISLLVLGIVLLFIVTFVCVWKSEWSSFDKETNSKSAVIRGALKALFNFIAVPVIAFFGIFVGNALLRAINSATGAGDDVLMSDIVMTSLMTNAVRVDSRNIGKSDNLALKNANIAEAGENGKQGILRYFMNNRGEIVVTDILEAFKRNWTISGADAGKYEIKSDEGAGDWLVEFFDDSIDVDSINRELDSGTLVFSYDDKELVRFFFDYSEVNYVLGYIVLIIMVGTLLKITYGLVKRLFVLLILFIVSPPIVALSPINPKLISNWREMFIGNVAMAYVFIAIFNIFMSIYPLFANIRLFADNEGVLQTLVNIFTPLLVICVGLLTITSVESRISEWILGKGYDVSSQSEGGWNKAFSMAGKALKPMTMPVKAVGKVRQYAHTGAYHGMGAMLKTMGKDALGVGKKVATAGPLNEMWKGAGVNKDLFKSYAAVNKDRKELGIKDTKKAVKETKKTINAEIDAAANLLGIQGNKKDRERQIQSNVENYNKNKGIVDSLKADIESGKIEKGSDQYKEYMDAKQVLDHIEASGQTENIERLASAYADKQTLERSGAYGQVKLNNDLPQYQGNRAAAEATREVMAKYTALNDATEEATEEAKAEAKAETEEAKAEAKAETEEAKAEAKDEVQKQKESFDKLKEDYKQSKDKDAAKKQMQDLDKAIDKITRTNSNVRELQDLKHEIKKLSSKIDRQNNRKR